MWVVWLVGVGGVVLALGFILPWGPRTGGRLDMTTARRVARHGRVRGVTALARLIVDSDPTRRRRAGGRCG